MRDLTIQERTAMEAVARHFAATWEKDGLTVARLVELVILQRTRMLERMTAPKAGPHRGMASRP